MREPPPSLEADAAASLSSSMQERMIYLDFRCYFLGELRRIDLKTRFGIGSAAATRDIAHYKKELGAKIDLDPVTKIYRPTRRFRPLFPHNIEQVLLGLSRGSGETHVKQRRPLLPCDVPQALSLPSAEILAPITRAIHAGRAVRVTYSSFSSGRDSREVVPFALADNGLRWHVRVFDRRRKQFIDLVLTRVHSVEEIPNSRVEDHERMENDFEWGRVLELELVPHPKERRPEIVEMDYAMQNGVRKIRVRAALASYMLLQWIVDCSPKHSLQGVEYRLWLRNNPILYGVANAHLAPGYQPQEKA